MFLKRGMIGEQVKAWQNFLNEQGYNCGKADGIFGRDTESATKKFQVAYGLTDDGAAGSKTIKEAIDLGFEIPANKAIPETEGVTLEQLSYIMKTAKRSVLEKHLPYVNKIMAKYEINTPLRKQHFLAQVGHESVSLMYMQEIASGSAYEGRADLGNTKPGDGKKFKGHGPIQITGRANHTAYFESIGRLDLLDKMDEFVNDLELLWGASGWYWSTRKLNKYADNDDVTTITKRINGGLNGFTDRKQYLARAKEVIK